MRVDKMTWEDSIKKDEKRKFENQQHGQKS